MSKSLIWSVGVVGVVVALVVGSFIYISNKAETDLVNKNTKAGIDLYGEEKIENPTEATHFHGVGVTRDWFIQNVVPDGKFLRQIDDTYFYWGPN